MTPFLIFLSATATWAGLCLAAFRLPDAVAAVLGFFARHGGRHAR